jgi:8-oxoguanine deaminase
MTLLIRNAHAILTGLPGAASRHAGPDMRIRDGVIEAMGALSPLADERIIDARDCVVYPAWVNTHHHLFQSLLKGEPQGRLTVFARRSTKALFGWRCALG